MGVLEGIIYMVWRGLAIGIIMSAPMGPVGILCIQRTLEKGRWTGFFTGIGAAISDLFYCLLTGFGLSFIEDFLKANQNIIQIAGSIVLAIFGIYLFRSNPARAIKKPEFRKASHGKNILSGFLFTFSNPLIVFLCIGLFARFNFLLPEITFYQTVIGYIFIIIGALLWWWLVTFFVDKVRAHFNLRSMWLINKITGGIIMVFSLVGVITAFTGTASASGNASVPFYLNSSDGFGPLGDGHVRSSGPSDSLRTVSIAGIGDFRLSFRASNLNGVNHKSYQYEDSSGRKKKVSCPEWGVRFSGIGFPAKQISLKPMGRQFDAVSRDAVRVAADNVSKDFTGVLDSGSGQNAFLLLREENVFTLYGGTRAYTRLASVECEGAVSEISFYTVPGGDVLIDNFSITPVSYIADRADDEARTYETDAVKDRIRRSEDPLEGIWTILDRTMEDDLLRPGGDYTIAVVRAESARIAAQEGHENGNADVSKTYDIVYIDGAVRNPGLWKPGRVKGQIMESPTRGVYDVIWLDAESHPLPGEIKATVESDILALQMPVLQSTVRFLRK